MLVAYADPPYPGMSHYYKDHPDYGGEVDHAALIDSMTLRFDAWVLHTASTTLQQVLALCPKDVRVLAWTKTFASWKPGVWPAYAWEPVVMHGGRNHSNGTRATVCDWFACPTTLQKGLTGAKPPQVCEWLFRALGMEPDDELCDLYPGTGAVGRAWDHFRSALVLA